MTSRLFIALLTATMATNISSASDPGIDSIADALANMAGYAARVRYAVTLPQAEDDVVYTVDLRQPLSVDSYLIDWSVDSPSGPVDGFTAWFEGHFYNFRNRRLQEHHDGVDPAAGGVRSVQNSAQFASLLPSRLAMTLREVASGGYVYNVHPAGGEIIVDAVRTIAGEPDAELTWRFDAATFAPRSFYADYNPGGITGQQVKADYLSAEPIDTMLSEAFLRARYHDAFSRFRENHFAIENMRGERLPAFSLPRLEGGRLERNADDGFDCPTVVVLVNPESVTAPVLVNDVRRAIMRLPLTAEVVWACSQKNPESAAELFGQLREGETVVTSAESLAVDCGAAVLPVVLVCRPDGRISDLTIGLNNSLEADVIEMVLRLATVGSGQWAVGSG